MAKLNEIRFFLLVSLMIIATRALEVFLANDEGDYNIRTEISVGYRNGEKVYVPGSHKKYTTRNTTYKVILYIVKPDRFSEIMQPELRDKRIKISEELYRGLAHFELFYMVINGFQVELDEPVIRAFIRDTIKQHTSPFGRRYVFRTIGDINLEVTSVTPDLDESTDFIKYIETSWVFGEKLQDHLEQLSGTTIQLNFENS